MEGIDSGDAAWVLTSSALVLLMTPGLGFFYGGLVRQTNIINTMMMSIISMGCVGILWGIVGFSLSFGRHLTAVQFIGNLDFVFLQSLDSELWTAEGVATTIPGLLYATFQMTFCIISAAIMSGAVVERMRFHAYSVFVSLWSLLVYAPICHWVWGGGWIMNMGALDFAGGTVVHLSSGTSALVAALLLGKRMQAIGSHKPHNVPFVLLGGGLLWFGWTGFNGGSALAANEIAARAVVNTYLAGCSAMLAWLALERWTEGRPTSVGAVVGAVAGLVVITPAAGYVTPFGAIVMGLIGAPICNCAVTVQNTWTRMDDSLNAFGLHGVGGIAGAILTGIFAIDGGLFYGGGFALLGKQLASVAGTAAYSAAVTAIIFKVLMLLVSVRASEEAEAGGLDSHLHGENAYVAMNDLVATPLPPPPGASQLKRYFSAVSTLNLSADES